MNDEKDEEHYREVSKLCFEYCKHLTTLASEAALVEIGLYQQFHFSAGATVFGLLFLPVENA